MILRVGKILTIACVLALTASADDTDIPAAGAETTENTDVWAGFEAAVEAARGAMVGAPSEAFSHAETAQSAIPTGVSAAERNRALATAYWLQAEALNRTNASDAASPVIDDALELLGEDAQTTTLRGDILLTRGRIAQRLGNIQVALESFREAYEEFRILGIARQQSSALQKIADIHSDAQDFEQAIAYYEQSLEVYSEDPQFSYVSNNNIANALRGLARYDEAADYYQRALNVVTESGAPGFIRARILTNLSHMQVLGGNVDAAEQTADQALGFMDAGQFSGWEPFLWGVKAEIAYSRGDLEVARQLIGRTFEGENLQTTTMPFREMHETAYRIYQDNGDYSEAVQHLEAFKRLDDEALSLAASTNSALMAAEFNFANQELRIQQLRGQQLQQEVEIAEARARQRTLLLGSLLAGGVLILGFLTAGYVSVRRSRDAIGRVNDRLNDTNQQLDKANKAKSEFLATTSHEIRTPLNGILGMAQVILQDQDLSPELRDRLGVVQTAGKSMKAIVDDLLDVAKIETGEVSVQVGEVQIRELIEEACLLWKGSAEEKGLDFHLDMTDFPAVVRTDEQRLRQIFFNLLSNAVKFTETGRVDVVVTCESIDGVSRLNFAVTDTGIGIPASEHENIFAPFHQVDGAMTRKYAGTGLGLSICKSFTEALDGSISVRSAPGAGATFTVSVPVERIAGAEPEPDMSDDVGLAPITSIAEARVLILQPDFMQKMIFEAFFADETKHSLVVDSAEAFTEALATGTHHFAVYDAAGEDVPEVEDADRQTCLMVWGEAEKAPKGAVSVADSYEAETVLAALQRQMDEHSDMFSGDFSQKYESISG